LIFRVGMVDIIGVGIITLSGRIVRNLIQKWRASAREIRGTSEITVAGGIVTLNGRSRV
jgi:hypothetical protein